MGESRAVGSRSNGEHHCLFYKKDNGVYGEIAAIQAHRMDLTQYLGAFPKQILQSLTAVHMSSIQLLGYQFVIAECC
jgi:hypothetical protein